MEHNGQVYIDWLTVTTWDILEYLEVVEYLQRRHKNWKPAKVMQYRGQQTGGIFYGLAEQTNGKGEVKAHGMVRLSGHNAHEVVYYDLIWLHGKERWFTKWKCSRIDIESTKLPPKRYNLHSAYKRIRKPKSIIIGDNTTLYIGNRAESPIFTRIYEKGKYLRLEFELKHDRAQWALMHILNGVSPEDIFTTIQQASRVPQMYINHFAVDGKEIDYEKAERKADSERKLQWLRTIEQSLSELQDDHDVGEEARQIIRRMYEFGQKVDKSLTEPL